MSKCEKSYSGEHAFIPVKPEEGYLLNKCVLCGYKQNVSEGIYLLRQVKK